MWLTKGIQSWLPPVKHQIQRCKWVALAVYSYILLMQSNLQILTKAQVYHWYPCGHHLNQEANSNILQWHCRFCSSCISIFVHCQWTSQMDWRKLGSPYSAQLATDWNSSMGSPLRLASLRRASLRWREGSQGLSGESLYLEHDQWWLWAMICLHTYRPWVLPRTFRLTTDAVLSCLEYLALVDSREGLESTEWKEQLEWHVLKLTWSGVWLGFTVGWLIGL